MQCQAAQAEPPQLEYDYGLEQTAMRRAAELILAFNDELRPNNTRISTLYTNANVVENISAMGSTAAQIYSAWAANQTASEYRNMVDETKLAIGIGHVTYYGRDYWVAAFSDQRSGTGVLPEDNGTMTRTTELESTDRHHYHERGGLL